MKKTGRLFGLIFPFLFLFSCANSDILFITEPISRYLSIESNEEKEYGNICRQAGFSLKFLQVSADSGISELTEAVALNTAQFLILSPLLSYTVFKLAEQFPERTFIASGANVDNLSKNIILIYSDRTDEYRKAGEVAATFLNRRSKEFCESIFMSAVFFTETRKRVREMSAFLDGYAKFGNLLNLEVKEISNIRERGEVTTFLNSPKSKKASLIFFSAANLNEYCLEMVSGRDILIIIEDSSIIEEMYENIIFFSINEDYPDALKGALNSLNSGNTEEIRIPCKLIPGKAVKAVPEFLE